MTDSLSQQEAEVRVMDAWLGWGVWGAQSQIRTLPAERGRALALQEERPLMATPKAGGHEQRMVCQLGGKKALRGKVRTRR